MSSEKFLPPIPAFKVEQGSFTFYLAKISAKLLLSISYTSERTKQNRAGIQRGLRRDRLINIGKYLSGKISGEPVLPNTIIVSLSSDSYFSDGNLYICDKKYSEAFVIDGQHRLWSFQKEFSEDVDFDIIISAFINLPDEKKALIFKIINGEQRKINPSLVYDLIPMIKNKEWIDFENWRSQEIVSFLNEDTKSPWQNRISMVGEPGKIISQSSFITAIKKLFKAGHLFHDTGILGQSEEVIQEKILVAYFISIADQYSVEWDNKDYLLCKYVGVSALLNLLELIVGDMKIKNVIIISDIGLEIDAKAFEPYILKLRHFNFSNKDEKKLGKTYVGEAGVSELFKKVSQIVF